jgi:uncharacterized integral membrane protein
VLSIPPCLDNRLTDGGKVFRPMHPPRFIIIIGIIIIILFLVFISVRG